MHFCSILSHHILILSLKPSDFWGIHPVDETALNAEMAANGLFLSDEVRTQLQRYATLIPRDQASFIQHFEEVHPGKKDEECQSPLYGCGWYNDWYPRWNEATANDAVSALEGIINKYYPDTPASAPTVSPFVCEDTRITLLCRIRRFFGLCPGSGCAKTCDQCDAR